MKRIYKSVVMVAVLALGLANITVSTAQAAPAGSAPDAVVGEAQLITGDRVGLTADGEVSRITPAPRPDGSTPQFSTSADGDQVYVIPDDVEALVPDQLDRELFNVTKLSSYGLDDTVPVIVTQADDVPVQETAQEVSQLGVEVTDSLDTLSTQVGAADVSTDNGPAPTWGLLEELGTPPTSDSDPVSSQTKVWLDQQVQMDSSFIPLAASAAPEPGWMSAIGRDEAHAEGYTGTGVTVGIVDSGIDANHPDLVGQVKAVRDFTGTGLGDGYGHGTFVASEIAGTGAASGGQYAGVAPDAQLLVARVLNSRGAGSDSAILGGLEWAAQQGADVINLSIGINGGYDDGSSPSSVFVNRLVRQYGCTIVIASGNDGLPQTVSAPSTADEALSVGASYQDGSLASFSSYGPRRGDGAVKPEILAPGAATRVTGDGIIGAQANSTTYRSGVGTSMAAPLVTGAVALLKQEDPSLTPDQVRARLMASARPLALTVFQQGAGMLNIPAALAQTVTTSPSQLNLDTVPFPTATLTYVNEGSEDQTYTLTTSSRFAAKVGDPVAMSVPDLSTDDAITVSADTVTVPAHGTAEVGVRLNPSGFSAGYVGGYVTATSGAAVIQTPVGWANLAKALTVALTADTGSAPAGQPITVTASVRTGTTPVANAPVSFTSASHSVTVTGEEGTTTCVTGQDGTCAVTIASDVPGTYTNGVSANIVGMNPTVTGSPLTVAFTEPQITVSMTSQSLSMTMDTPYGDHSVLVWAKDDKGQLVDGVTVDFTVEGGSVAMRDESCITGVGEIVNLDVWQMPQTGYCTARFYPVQPGTSTIHAFRDGVEINGSPESVTVTPGAAQTTQLQVAHAGQPADGTSATILTGWAYDDMGRPEADVNLSFSTDTPGAHVSTGVCTTGEDGSCFVTLTSTAAGAVWVHALRNGSDIMASPAGIIFGPETACSALQGNGALSCVGSVTVTSMGAGSSSASAPVGTSVAVGALLTQWPLSWPAGVDGPFSPALEGVEVDFVLTGDAQASSTTCTTDEKGYCSIAITSTDPGTVSVNAFVGEWGLSGPLAPNTPKTVTFTDASVPSGDWFSVVATSRSAVPADGVSTWTGTLTLTDDDGQPLTSASSQDIGFILPDEVSVSDLTNDGDGAYTVTFTSTTPGEYEITAYAAPVSVDGLVVSYWPMANAHATISFEPVDRVTVTLEGFQSGLQLDSWAVAGSAFVSAKDAQGQLVNGVRVDFTEEGDAVALTDSSCITGEGDIRNGDAISPPMPGYCTASFHGVQPGTALVHIFYDGVEVEGSPIHVSVSPGSSQATRLEVTRSGQPADGVSTDVVTAWAFDELGVPMPGTDLRFSIDGTGARLSADICTTGEDGSCVVTVTSTTAGGFMVHAYLGVNELNYSPAGLIFGPGIACPVLADNGPLSCVSNYIVTTVDSNTFNPPDEEPIGTSVEIGVYLGESQPLGMPFLFNMGGINVHFLIEGDHEATATSCTTGDQWGSCSIVITSTNPGDVTVRGFVGDWEVAESPVVIHFADKPHPAGDWFTVAPTSGSTVPADGVSSWTGTVTLVNDGYPYTTASSQMIGFIVPDEVSVSDITNNGDGTYTVGFTSTTPGRYEITAYGSASGWSETLANVPVTISFQDTTPIPDPDQSSLTTSTDTVTLTYPACGGDPAIDPASVTVTATVKDTTGAPMSGAMVDFSVSPGLDLTGASSVRTNADGIATTAVALDPAAGESASVLASVGGVRIGTASLLVAVVESQPPMRLPSLTVAPTVSSPVWADGESSYTATVTYLDGCNVAVSGVEVRFDVTGQAHLSAASGLTDENGVFTIVVTDTGAEQVELSASTMEGGHSTLANGSPASLTFVDPQGPPSPTVSKANATQISGSAQAGTTVVVTYPVDGGTSQAEADVSASGAWTLPTPVDAQDGPLTVAARDSLGRLSVSAPAVLDVTAPGQPIVSMANDSEISGTSEADAWIQVMDATGESLGSVTADGEGHWLVPTPDHAVPGEITVTATDMAGNVSIPRTAMLSITLVSEPDPAQSTVSVSAESIGVQFAACGAPTTLHPEFVTATAVIRDSEGHPLSGVTVDFTVDSPLVISGSASEETGADGVAQVSVTVDLETMPSVGMVNGYVHAAVSGVEMGSPAPLQVANLVTVLPPPAPQLSVEAASVPVWADGVSAWTATVTSLDLCGAPVEGLEIQFSVTGGATLSDATVTTGADGRAVTSVTSTVPGEVDVSATAISGMQVVNTPVTVQFEAVPPVVPTPDPANSTAALSESGMNVFYRLCGDAPIVSPTSVTVSVVVRDASGVVVPGASVDFSADAPLHLDAAQAVSDEEGVARVRVSLDLSQTLVMYPQIRVSVGGAEISNSPLSVVIAQAMPHPVPGHFVVSATPASGTTPVVADGVSAWAIDVQAYDMCDVAIKNTEVNFTMAGQLSPISVLTDDNGRVSINVTSTTAQSVTVDISGDFIDPADTVIVFAPAPSQSPTSTPSRTVTSTPSPTSSTSPSQTVTSTSSQSPTSTPSRTVTSTPSPTSSTSPSRTVTSTPSPTSSTSPSQTVTSTPSQSPTSTPSRTVTSTPSRTVTSTPSQSPTSTPTQTVTSTPSRTVTSTPTQTVTSTPTQTVTSTPSRTVTSTPTQTVTSTPSQTVTSVPSQSPTSTPTQTVTSTPTRTVTSTPSQTVTSTSSQGSTPTSTVTATSPTSTPSLTSSPGSSATPTQFTTATSAPTPTVTSTAMPTPNSIVTATGNSSPGAGSGAITPTGGSADPYLPLFPIVVFLLVLAGLACILYSRPAKNSRGR